MRVLITGGCGFVGAFTALELVEHGHQVVCYDRRPVRNDVLERAGLNVTIVEGDVCDRDGLAAAVRERIAQMPQLALLLFGHHFEIRQRGVQLRVPVH